MPRIFAGMKGSSLRNQDTSTAFGCIGEAAAGQAWELAIIPGETQVVVAYAKTKNGPCQIHANESGEFAIVAQCKKGNSKDALKLRRPLAIGLIYLEKGSTMRVKEYAVSLKGRRMHLTSTASTLAETEAKKPQIAKLIALANRSKGGPLT